MLQLNSANIRAALIGIAIGLAILLGRAIYAHAQPPVRPQVTKQQPSTTAPISDVSVHVQPPATCDNPQPNAPRCPDGKLARLHANVTTATNSSLICIGSGGWYCGDREIVPVAPHWQYAQPNRGEQPW